MKEMTTIASVERLDEVLDFVNESLAEHGCDAKTQSQINISVEEIFVNIAHYAYNPETGGAVIRIAVGDEVAIEFEDNGVPYNPLLKTDPDVTKTVEEREIGGLGIFMVKKIMDTVEYRHDNNRNVLTIKKRINGF